MKNIMSSLLEKRELSKLGGGVEKIARQHQLGKLTARDRIEVLLDAGSFEEHGVFEEHRCTDFDMQGKIIPGDGVVVGYGTIHNRPVFVYSQDFTVIGGSLGEVHARKICKMIDKACALGVPVIGINDSGGARIQEGVDALGGYGEIFQRNIDASGVIPQISLVMGPCAGGAVYSPALTDFIFMVKKTSYMFVTGPGVVKQVTHETITAENLGGAEVHSEKTGVADRIYDNDIDLLMDVRRFFTFLPLSNSSPVPRVKYSGVIERNEEEQICLDSLVPSDSNKPYDMKELVLNILDGNDFFEIQPLHAKNIIVGFGRITGYTVGIVANQPMEKAGCLDIDASRKAARFIRFCDAFNIPIITLVDVPGFLPGSEQEHKSIIKHGAKLLYAYGECTVPKISVVTRKAYGGAYIVMNSKHLRSDMNYSWANTEIAVMGCKGAIEVLFGKTNMSDEEREVKMKEYKDKFTGPMFAASRGFIDEVIRPRNTRWRLARALNILIGKKVAHPKYPRKHDNLPM